MVIKTLLADWDDTLVKFNVAKLLAEERCVRLLISHLGLDKKMFDQLLERYRRISSAYDKIHLYDRERYWTETVDSFGVQTDHRLIGEIVFYYWDIVANESEVYEGVKETLFFLKHSNVKIAIIGDSDGIPSNKRRRVKRNSELVQFIDAIFVAGEDVPKTKPDPQIFRYALRKLGAKPEQTAMIGDKCFTDLYGAKLLGITTIWLKLSGWEYKESPKLFKADFTVTSFPQILKIIPFC